MNNMKEIALADQQKIELNVLRVIDAFCRKHNIRYMLSAGTLLGAIRHKGFIPWDDDVDIVMPRLDYERFYQIFNALNEDPKYKLVSSRDRSMAYPFLKVIDTSTLVLEDYVSPEYNKLGLWVDIYPIDGAPPMESYREFRKLKFMHGMAMSDPKSAATTSKRIAKRILKTLLGNPTPYEISERYDAKAQEVPITEGGEVAVVIWGYREKERMPYEYLERTEVEFEGNLFFASKMWDQYLTQLFGDYMQLPPENQRVPHGMHAYYL